MYSSLQSLLKNVRAEKHSSITMIKDAKSHFLSAQESISSRSVENTSLFKDLPRLVRRVQVKDKHSNTVFDGYNSTYGVESEELHPNAQTLLLIRRLILTLATELDDRTENGMNDLSDKLNKIILVSKNSEMELVIEKMVFETGIRSKTAELLKYVNQSITLNAMNFLKSTIIQEYSTKDVREQGGWKILISFEMADETFNLWKDLRQDSNALYDERKADFERQPICLKNHLLSYVTSCENLEPNVPINYESIGEGIEHPYILVSHFRKEQSADVFGDKSEHFEFSWNVGIHLHYTELKLIKVGLNVIDLRFDRATMPRKKAKKLRKDLAIGRIV